MKESHLIFTLGILTIFGFLTTAPNHFNPVSQEQVLRHVVLLDLSDQATDSVVKKMEKDLQNLKEEIPQIIDLEFGANLQNDADYSHCLFLTFEDTKSLKQYEEHPAHLKFASTYGKYVVNMTEVDYLVLRIS